MPTVGGHNAKATLATRLNAMLLHQTLHPLLAHANALCPQLPPDARPTIGSTVLRIGRANVHQQCLFAQVAALRDLPAPRQMLVVTGDAHLEHPALHTDRPDPPVALNNGILHFWPFAKYAIAFPRMSRSIVTRVNSARRRLISICSALTCALPLAPLSVPPRCAFTQFDKVCSTTPRVRAADARPCPESTCRTASCLNSSVYFFRVAFVIF